MPYKDPEERKRKHALFSAAHYQKNKEEAKARTTKQRQFGKKKWDAFKLSLKCTKCGFSHPAALDFHHRDPTEKESTVSKLVSNKRFTRAMEEVEKCEVLCANCHRIHHWDEIKLLQLQKT
jgi:hypothetical protein